jgi:hypothetical protein
MTNKDTYIKALQIKWILRLLENSNENWHDYGPQMFRHTIFDKRGAIL